MKKTILLLILLIINTALGNALLIEPATITTSANVNEEKKIELSITNDQSFIIYDIEFSGNPYITYPAKISQLGINGTIKKNITILTNADFSTAQYVSLIKFFYFQDISFPSKTHDINITDSQYVPLKITIIKGDSIKWKNYGSLQHSVTSSDFNVMLQPNGETTISFNEIKYIDYHDTNTGFHGFINVTNQSSQLTHNPDFDKSFVINLESRFRDTTIELSIVDKSDFTVSHNSYEEGLLKISNTGDKKAISLNLKADKSWIAFNKNNFNLSAGSNSFITFSINPVAASIAETNNTHQIKITLQSSNAGSKESNINVFVPYENSLEEDLRNKSYDQLLEEARKLREALDKLQPPQNPEPIIIYKESEVPYNYTQTDIFNMYIRLGNIEKAIGDTSKFSNEKTQSIDSRLENQLIQVDNLLLVANESLQLGLENKKRIDNTSVTVIILIIIVSALVLGTILIFTLVKYKKKSLMEQLMK